MPFFILFVMIPLTEVLVFMAVGEHIGIWTTLFLALLTAIIGGALVKHQGIQTLIAMRMASDVGKIPLDEIFDGFCLLIAGALLITPGFVTDTIGFSLLLPVFRDFLRRVIRNRTSWVLDGETLRRRPDADSSVIEGEYQKMEEERTNNKDT